MAEITVTLKHGLAVGRDTLTVALIRDARAGDVIEAQEEAEKLVYTPDGPQLVPSPTLVTAHVLRRQVVRLSGASGAPLQGPLSLDDLKRLHPEDLNRLQAEALQLEAAAEATSASQAVTQRGRSDGQGGAD